MMRPGNVRLEEILFRTSAAIPAFRNTCMGQTGSDRKSCGTNLNLNNQ